MSERPGPREPRRYAFPPCYRLRGGRDFERVMKRGVRMSDERLQVWGAANGLPYSRLGLVVGRRHGPAVRRFRLKRLLREAFRLSRPGLPAGLDIACAPRPAAPLTLSGAMQSLDSLCRRLANRLGAANRP